MAYEDPWAWTNERRPVAPLSANIQASNEQAPAPIYTQPDQTTQQLKGMVVGKGLSEGVDATT